MIDEIPKVVGMVYGIAVTLLVVVLLRKGKLNTRVGYVLLGLSTLMGFLVFAPMLPVQFQSLLLGNTGQLGVPLALAGVVLFFFVLVSLVFGRAFCSHVCPIGAVQELLYLLPGKKIIVKSRSLPAAVRILSLVAFLVLALAFSKGLLSYLGIQGFFHLDFTPAYAYVFVAFLAGGIFLYRPFCRFLCPYGVFLWLGASRARFRLVRNDRCTDCKKCEKVCPTNEAGRTASKQECYLCGRCQDACRFDAIEYRRYSGLGDYPAEQPTKVKEQVAGR